ncbi:helix-turn-helix domain-containing protein [Roseibium alexandrii]|uniref:Exoenzyme S synthesis regulatory protein ExsA n=1 Tax=Roseibium alexandrii TaxID=388408 RepID=A0A0M7ASD8_9HYPH|nr:helix-turn-helix domain-containing protein [Roseibium alexandrii]CTQ76713.1 Exoenzyme S synthesis regulatory protein ExsA [Roseibium alexandrii]
MDADQIERAVLHTTDFEELQDAAVDWDQQYLQMAPGNFQGALDLTKIGSRQIFRETWGKKLRYQGTAPKGAFGFALRLDKGGPANWVGRPAGADSVILQAPGREADLVSSDFWDCLVLGISEEEVTETVGALTGGEDLSSEFHGVLELKPDVTEKLKRLGLDFLSLSKSNCIADEPAIAKSSKQLVGLFLWEIVRAFESPDLVVETSKSSLIVKQATDLISSEQADGTGLVEICSNLGVSLRSLHYAFQDVTGMSPAAWLRRVRLNRVHKTLLQSSTEEVMVKQVAMENGFVHAGHFCNQYSKLFGCLPSETLQRANA